MNIIINTKNTRIRKIKNLEKLSLNYNDNYSRPGFGGKKKYDLSSLNKIVNCTLKCLKLLTKLPLCLKYLSRFGKF